MKRTPAAPLWSTLRNWKLRGRGLRGRGSQEELGVQRRSSGEGLEGEGHMGGTRVRGRARAVLLCHALIPDISLYLWVFCLSVFISFSLKQPAANKHNTQQGRDAKWRRGTRDEMKWNKGTVGREWTWINNKMGLVERSRVCGEEKTERKWLD